MQTASKLAGGATSGIVQADIWFGAPAEVSFRLA